MSRIPYDVDPCIAEGCDYPEWSATCRVCGETNYHYLGWLGFIGRMAKKWTVSKEEAWERICIEQARKEEARNVGRVMA